ncbi:MAG: 2,4-dihydroxyhept-2-ene-1,7-dioic acid aldolase [Deltaproteobacteria bacterium]|jgi:2-dehydro-3-deoxyglucarate aldolase/4-hydroxy-2-oxoheptanedioate aldolase|nr:2,4-dihydroxyhept-2-ene-1,7-dioic acid aldolase [Deltaproteobacteria bacterium]
MKNSLRKMMARKSPLVGTMVTLPSPETAEILCSAGFDWFFIDLEHSAMSVRDAQSILQAASPQVACVIRVPSNDEIWIKKCLDIGASGIIVPQIQSAEEAAQAVQWCRYPPKGSRSVGIARAQGYGASFKAYVDSANAETAVILQIEHINAIHNITSIVGIPGIDCLFIGPYDLSASMGKMGQVNDPEVRAAISKVKTCADASDIPTGIFGMTPGAVRPYIDDGFALIAVSLDTMILGDAAKAIRDASGV